MVFFISLFVITFIFAFVSAFTKVASRGKKPFEMSGFDRMILNDTITLPSRLLYFVNMFFTGLLFPPSIIASGLIYGAYKWFLSK